MKLIQPVTPERNADNLGFWTHPDFFEPANGNEYPAPGEFEAWAKAQGVEVYTLSLDADPAADHIQAAYKEGDADVSGWDPTPPIGEGWFLASVHDTEDGPYSIWFRRNTEEQAEIAALKGDQVPVAWTSQRSLETKNKIVAFTDDMSALDYGVANGWTDIVELFTAPQKLTDLPYDVLFNAIAKSATPLGEHMSISVKDFKAAIEAAGGLSTPQATIEAAPQKPVISKEKLCDWLEDNFDIDDSQRDAFANCFAHQCNCIVKKED